MSAAERLQHRVWCGDPALCGLGVLTHNSEPRVIHAVTGSRAEVFLTDDELRSDPLVIVEIYVPAYEGDPADADTEPMGVMAVRPPLARQLAAALVELADLAEGVAA